MARSNPVLSNAFPEQTFRGAPNQTTYGTVPDPYGYGTTPPGYIQPGRLTIDDVVMHTMGLLVVLVAVAAAAWSLVPYEAGLGLVIPAIFVAIGILFYTRYKKRVSPAAAIAYAVVEGYIVGVISHVYNDLDKARDLESGVHNAFNGIVLQAVVASVAVFFAMLALYQTGVIRATPKFKKLVMTATLGIFVTYLVSIVMSQFFHAQMPLLNSHSGLGILVSAVIVVVAALNFILDFDQIERAIAAGAPRETAWAAALGLVVTLVWLYLEMLRLLSKLRSR